MRRRSTGLYLALAAAVPAMLAAVWAALVYAPEEKTMGAVQRIFYFHVPSAFVAFGSTFLLLAGSIGYLWTRRAAWDRLSRASCDLALLFCTLVLLTGPIWARPVWGVWWTWEAKLTTTLVLWLLLLGCAAVRRQARSRDQGARLAAVLGIVAALDVPVIYNAVSWWRGNHPQVFTPGAEGGLDPRMRTAFGVCTLAFFVLWLALLSLSVAVAEVEDRAAELTESRSM